MGRQVESRVMRVRYENVSILYCLNMYLELDVSPMVLCTYPVPSEIYVHFTGNFDILEGPEGQTNHWLDGHISGLICFGQVLSSLSFQASSRGLVHLRCSSLMYMCFLSSVSHTTLM